jgi:flagellin
MTSISSNVSALLAQRFLRTNASETAETQARTASGERVQATQDAASFAVAASARGDVKAFAAAASAMQGATAAGMVAVSAGETIVGRLGDVRAKLAQLADESLAPKSRAALNAELAAIVGGINEQLAGATFNGINLLSGAGADKAIPGGRDGSPATLRDNDVRPLSLGPVGGVADAAGALLRVDAFRQSLDGALRNLGGDLSQLRARAEVAQQTGEANSFGLGALVNVDLARESASLASLQVRQQLSGTSMGIANQTPSALLSLLR